MCDDNLVDRYLLTVVVASYNKGLYIRECLESLLKQSTSFKFKIVIADDGSTDDTINILKEYEKLENVEVWQSDCNQGLFKNVYRVYDQIKTRYFMLFGADDYLTDVDMFSKGVEFLEQNKNYSIYQFNSWILSDDEKNGEPFIKLDSSRFTYRGYVSGTENHGCLGVYRNCIFSNGVPDKIKNYWNSIEQEAFRAETALCLMHLHYGDGYFDNKCVSVYRVNGEGLWTSLNEFKKNLSNAFFFIVFYKHFNDEEDAYKKTIDSFYKQMVLLYTNDLLNNDQSELSDKEKQMFRVIFEWKLDNQTINPEKRISFSLEEFCEIHENGVVIWGTGLCAKRLIKKYHINDNDIKFFVDNNQEKWNTTIRGVRVIPPSELKKSIGDSKLMIMSWYYRDIIRQIVEDKLLNTNKIVNIMDYEENLIRI